MQRHAQAQLCGKRICVAGMDIYIHHHMNYVFLVILNTKQIYAFFFL